MNFPRQEIQQWITDHQSDLISTYSKMLKVPALSPENGGNGEYDKAQKILEILQSWVWHDIF